jgi:hypothetical protein
VTKVSIENRIIKIDEILLSDNINILKFKSVSSLVINASSG